MGAQGQPGSRWVRVAEVSEVAEGQVRGVWSEGWRLALVNRQGRIYAFWAVCPHRGGPLDRGTLWRGALECPWHHFRFDPATGANVYPACVYPPDMPELQEQLRPARVFPVEVCDGLVFVELPTRREG